MKKIALFLAVLLLLAGCAAPAATEDTDTAALPTLSGEHGGTTIDATRPKLDPSGKGHSVLPSQTEPRYTAQDAVLVIAEVVGHSRKQPAFREESRYALPSENQTFSFADSGTLEFSVEADSDNFAKITVSTPDCYVRNGRLKQSADEFKLQLGETVFLTVGSGDSEQVCALWLEDGR